MRVAWGDLERFCSNRSRVLGLCQKDREPALVLLSRDVYFPITSFFINLFILFYFILFIFGCVGSSLLRAGFL